MATEYFSPKLLFYAILFNRSVQLLHERDDLSLVWRDQSVTIGDLFNIGLAFPPMLAGLPFFWTYQY
jgi:hypothetical protein